MGTPLLTMKTPRNRSPNASRIETLASSVANVELRPTNQNREARLLATKKKCPTDPTSGLKSKCMYDPRSDRPDREKKHSDIKHEKRTGPPRGGFPVCPIPPDLRGRIVSNGKFLLR